MSAPTPDDAPETFGIIILMCFTLLFGLLLMWLPMCLMGMICK